VATFDVIDCAPWTAVQFFCGLVQLLQLLACWLVQLLAVNFNRRLRFRPRRLSATTAESAAATGAISTARMMRNSFIAGLFFATIF
jgi:hypothetical protein